MVGGAGLTLLEWGPTRTNENAWRARVVDVFTEASWRRQGVAGELLQHCFDEAARRGVHELSLGATPTSRALYERLGFRVVQTEMRWTSPAPGG